MTPDLIASRYRALSAIGRGGMGTVWLCRDELLNRDVAVKQVRTLPGESSLGTARAMREARSAAALHHENAVAIFDVVDHDGSPWLVMEYVEGQSLAQLVTEEGPLSPQRVARFGAQLAAALGQAHDLGIIHRDIKPSNVLITRDGRAKISDFGIARRDQDEQLTQVGLMTGTPAYFSPELARGADPSRASDVYALGATLYTAVEGRTPYEGDSNAINVLRRIDSSEPRPVYHAGPLRPALAGMMAPTPGARWTMGHSREALRDIAAGRSARSVPAPVPTPALAPVPAPESATPAPLGRGNKARTLLIAAAVLVVVIVTGLLGFLLFDGDAERAAAPSAPVSRGQASESSGPNGTPEVRHRVAAKQMEDFVNGYFATMPGGTDQGWRQLAPRMQAEVGRGSYDAFWGSIRDVQVTNASAHPKNLTVSLDITYTRADGSVSRESQLLTLQRRGGGLLIASDEVLGS